MVDVFIIVVGVVNVRLRLCVRYTVEVSMAVTGAVIVRDKFFVWKIVVGSVIVVVNVLEMNEVSVLVLASAVEMAVSVTVASGILSVVVETDVMVEAGLVTKQSQMLKSVTSILLYR